MKKFALICVALTIASILFLASWSLYNSLQDNKEVNNYGRFFTKNENGIKKFNWNSFHSPWQSENQEKTNGIVTFSFRVPYPIAPKFKLIDPIDGDKGEILVASQIQLILSDSIKRIKERFMFDYDGTSSEVRRYLNLDGLKLSEPEVKLSLFGTASPEAGKYGLFESMKPGNFEPENAELAKQRLVRTSNLLKEMGFQAKIVKFSEKQFSTIQQAEQAMKDKTILNKMRYVQVDAVINVEKLKVTTVTAPIFAPIWLLLLSLGLIYLWRLRIPKSRRLKMKFGKWSWKGFWEALWIIFRILSYVVIGAIILSIFITFWKWMLLLLSIITIVLAIYLIYKYWEEFLSFLGMIGLFFLLLGDYIFRMFILFIKWIFSLIKKFFRWLWILILDIWIFFSKVLRWLKNWWYLKTKCQKILTIVLPYAVLLTVYVIYLLWTHCPC
ncbi:MAG: hypothetical protein WCT42_03020 [Candidatus Paceibacterota bacterium]